ncbi:hypothetical protein RRG08_009919 [Elysia crispata]|uniref:Uncharacterized protein n=1 Tax=Elysia crispata TaxID=231223 RepID=A0AAE1AR83_9GAST|nr:hypothetical protein RRG08_009919 [Elysia crispata]
MNQSVFSLMVPTGSLIERGIAPKTTHRDCSSLTVRAAQRPASKRLSEDNHPLDLEMEDIGLHSNGGLSCYSQLLTQYGNSSSDQWQKTFLPRTEVQIHGRKLDLPQTEVQINADNLSCLRLKFRFMADNLSYLRLKFRLTQITCLASDSSSDSWQITCLASDSSSD